MPKNAALALLVVLVIAFSYWLGRHAAERATTAAEVAPAPPVAVQAPAPKAPPPPARKGMSWGVAANVETPDGIVLVGCHGEPATDTGGCDAHRGDTVCTSALPLLCLKVDDTPAPAGLRTLAADAALPDELHAAWVGGTVATTAPMPGTALKSREIADRACAAAFGDAWRLAEFHAGDREQRPVRGDPGGAQSPAVHARAGGGFYAAGDPIRTSRFWVAIDDRPANCWD